MILLLIPVAFSVQNNSFWKGSLHFSALHIWNTISVVVVYFTDPGILDSRLIALGTCVGLILLLTLVHKPIYPYLERISHTETKEIQWSAIGLAIG
jgi:hypothetical protein